MRVRLFVVVAARTTEKEQDLLRIFAHQKTPISLNSSRYLSASDCSRWRSSFNSSRSRKNEAIYMSLGSFGPTTITTPFAGTVLPLGGAIRLLHGDPAPAVFGGFWLQPDPSLTTPTNVRYCCNWSYPGLVDSGRVGKVKESHDAQESCTVCAGIPAPNGGAGARRA